MYKILLLGPQGSGKGTQAAILSEKLGIPALSMGQLLRDEIEKGGMIADRIRDIVHGGGLVGDDVAIVVLAKRLQEADALKGYILDGFPRNEEQFAAYDGYDQPTHVVVLNLQKDASLERIAHRARVEVRADDTPEVIAKRLALYDAETIPMLERHYTSRGIVHQVDASGTIQEVAERVWEAVNRIE